MNELLVVLDLFIPFAIAGLLLINTGLARSRSAAHMMMTGLVAVGIAVMVYFACGAAIELDESRALFLRGISDTEMRGVWFGAFAASLAVVIPLGTGAERWRLGPACISTALLAGLTIPLMAGWTWGGGWLAQLSTYGLGHGFVDCGGSGVIQATGGLTALSLAWILGPRRGKFTPERMPLAMPGHHAVFVLFGCLLALPGWIGLNAAGACVMPGADAAAKIGLNTTLAAAAASLTAAAITRIRFGKPDASLTANGWIGGLVASSAGCAFLAPAAAVIIGAIAGALIVFSVEFLELRLGIDDPGGSVSVHGIGGIWGLIAAGMLGSFPADQWLAQMIGVATLLGIIFPLTYGLNFLLNLIMRQRVAPEGERQGMDLHELGAGAYPDFLTHFDDTMQR